MRPRYLIEVEIGKGLELIEQSETSSSCYELIEQSDVKTISFLTALATVKESRLKNLGILGKFLSLPQNNASNSLKTITKSALSNWNNSLQNERLKSFGGKPSSHDRRLNA